MIKTCNYFCSNFRVITYSEYAIPYIILKKTVLQNISLLLLLKVEKHVDLWIVISYIYSDIIDFTPSKQHVQFSNCEYKEVVYYKVRIHYFSN